MANTKGQLASLFFDDFLEFEGTKQSFVGNYNRNLKDRTITLGGPKYTITPFGPPPMGAVGPDFKDRA